MLGLQVAYQDDTSFYTPDSCTSFCASLICMTSLEAAKVTAHNLPRVDEFVTYILQRNMVGGQELPEKLIMSIN